MDIQKHADLIFDVGMHRGEDTEFYLAKGFRVVAFEANPFLAEYCRRRFEKEISDQRLTIVEGAIVSTATIAAGTLQVPFYQNDSNSVWGTVCGDWMERNKRLGTRSSAIAVNVIDFRSAISSYGVPRYMKIDIEGCDLECLFALTSFSRRPDYVSIESNKTSLISARNELTLLKSLGYRTFQLVEQSSIPAVQKCHEPPLEGKHVDQQFAGGSSGLFGRELTAPWLSSSSIMRKQLAIHLGYCLFGDDGILTVTRIPGMWRLKEYVRGMIHAITKAPVPGWYDLHARHASVNH